MKRKHLFISGYAKLPSGTTAAELYKVVAVGILVDRESGQIMDADCSLVTSVAKEHVKDILVGNNILHIAEIEKEFIERYFGSAKKALISAVRKCHEKYIRILDNLEVEDSD